ncbi:Mss4-like protein [Microdochium bolleyi]|uniref:Mss4-like protein n=1 Tax=Microdochium bolleyi TaxID=196109 RepID=A0A136J4J0_9PEZI|nr:Mss4-like protein [Microdochium bolleyi]
MADSSSAWQNKPPYQLAASDSTTNNGEKTSGEETGARKFEKKLEARCHCGQVRYWIGRNKPLVAKFCHCRGCQKLHGAPFQWAAIFHKSDILFEHGSRGIEFYNSGSGSNAHDLPTKLSCSLCRAPIMDEGRRMVLLFPTLIDFARRPAVDNEDGLHADREREGGIQQQASEQRGVEEVEGLKKGFYPE